MLKDVFSTSMFKAHKYDKYSKFKYYCEVG